MTINEIKKLLGKPSPQTDPCMNARDVFDATLEAERKIGKDIMGQTPSRRVAEWFYEGYLAAQGDVGPETIPMIWVVTYRTERVSAMVAGVMAYHKVWADTYNDRIEVRR